MDTITPRSLKSGDTIGICAPSGSFDRSVFERGLDTIKQMGFKIYIPDGIYRKKRYLAGGDINRAEIINHLFKDDAVKAILCARGGFGAMRVLPFLDYEMIKQNPKIFVGFSDVTAILVTLEKRCSLNVFHGPVVTSLASAPRETLDSFFNILTSSPLSLSSFYTYSSALSGVSLLSGGRVLLQKGLSIYSGHATGILSGGNLATLSHLAGTSFQPDFNGCLVFIEDIGEPPYKIDRMLTQMKMSGMFGGIKGVVAGSFKDCSNKNMIFEILGEIFHDFHIPVMAGIKSGHGKINLTLPLGLEVTMDADDHILY